MQMRYQAVRGGKEVQITCPDFPFKTSIERMAQYWPVAALRAEMFPERHTVEGDQRSLFCDLVANLVPIEAAKSIAGLSGWYQLHC